MRKNSELGTTLIEVLITVVVLGSSFGALLSGLYVSVYSSGTHRRQADAEVSVRALSEYVKRSGSTAAGTYQTCSTMGNTGTLANASRFITGAPAPTFTPAMAFTNSVTKVEYWDTSTGSFKNWTGLLASCPATESGFARLTLTSKTTTAPVMTESIQIVKRAS